MKVSKLLGSIVIIAALISPSMVTANSNVSDVDYSTSISEKKFLVNPWTQEKVYYYNTESNDKQKKDISLTVHNASENETLQYNVLYDEEAANLLDQLKSEQYRVKQAEVFQRHLIEPSLNPQLIEPSLNPQLIETLSLKTKAWYRTEFTAVALGFYQMSWSKASAALSHSLQDNPSNREYAAGSSYSNSFSSTPSYTDISIPMAKAIDTAHKNGKSIVSGEGSYSTNKDNAGTDWYLTLGKYNYLWAAEKNSSNKWDVYIRISDKYDFDKVSVPSTFPKNLIAIISNHAVDAQTAGAIVPYYNILFFQQPNYKPQ